MRTPGTTPLKYWIEAVAAFCGSQAVGGTAFEFGLLSLNLFKDQVGTLVFRAFLFLSRFGEFLEPTCDLMHGQRPVAVSLHVDAYSLPKVTRLWSGVFRRGIGF